MNDLTVFQYEEKDVRTVTVDGEPWWVLKDVCAVLGLSSPHKVVERLDEDERNLIPLTDALGRLQQTSVINESGLYAVILRSDKPNAKAFRRWVTSEVLPTIRKHGAYVTANIEPGYTNTQRLGEVVELAKLTVRLMKDRKSKPDDIARTVGEQLEQFGIILPASFYPAETVVSIGVTSSSDTVHQFLSQCDGIKGRPVGEVYSDYLDYCTGEGITAIDDVRIFSKEVIRQTGVTSKAKRLNGKAIRVYT